MSENIVDNTTQVLDDVTQFVEDAPEVKTVSKELFDKTSSELASVKKQIKELQNKGKTDEQITADAIAEKEQLLKDYDLKLKETSFKLNKATAVSIVSEAKVKIALEKENPDFDNFLNIIVSDDEENSVKNAKCFNKLALTIYEKGFNDSKKAEWGNMTNEIKSVSNKNLSLGARYAQEVSGNKEEKLSWGNNNKK